MSCANVMTWLGSPVSVMSMERTMSFRCRSSQHLKPLRSCISYPSFQYKQCPSAAAAQVRTNTDRREKRVEFADSRGLSLISVRLFSDREDQPERLKQSQVKKLNCDTEDVKKISRLCLGFEQPCSDFHGFRSLLQQRLVLLESCKVSRCSIMGTVRVRNICFEKLIHIRITFNSWRSFQDVPCVYLDQCYGEPGTDVFEFSVMVPEVLKMGARIEFCVSYLAGGFSAVEWDNNDGKNYCVHVCED